MIYDQTDYSRHDKDTLKKTHPRTLFMEAILKTKCASRNFIFQWDFFPRLALTFCAKSFKLSDFP